MREAELHDGTILEFPDDTPDEVIQRVVKQHLGVKPRWEDQSGWNKANILTEPLYQGLTFGFGDEIQSGLDAAVKYLGGSDKSWKENYDKRLQYEKFVEKETADQHPWWNLIGNVVGGAAIPLGSMKGAKTLGQVALRGGKTGAGVGAVAGAGYTDGDWWDRLRGAGTGGAGGAVLGAALPAGFSALKTTGRALGGLAGIGTNEGRAAQAINRELQRADLTPTDVEQRIAEAQAQGIPLTPADLSTGLTNLGRTVNSLPGKAQNTLSKFYGERQIGQPARVTGQLEKGIGTEGNQYGTADEIMSRRAAEAAPLYERAYAGTADSPELQALLPRLKASGALDKASDIAAIEGQDVGVPPAMRHWDYVKRGLDSQIESYRDPTTGRLVLDDRGRALVGLRSELLNHLDNANPDYAAARSAYAGHSASLDALDLGRSFMRGDEEVLKSRFDKLSPAEQDMFRIGAVRELRGIISKAPDGANVARRIFGSPDKRARLRVLFPDDESFNVFSTAMDLEGTTTKTGQRILGGSQTADKQAAQAEMMTDFVEDMAISGRPTGLIRRWFTSILFRTNHVDEGTASHIADFLTGNTPPGEMPKLMKRLAGDEKFREQLIYAARAGGLGGGMAGGDLSTPLESSGFDQWMSPAPQ